MSIKVTDFARCQLRLACQDLKKGSGSRHLRLARNVRQVLSDPGALEDLVTPIPGLPQIPFLEVVVGDHRFFFRRVDNTLWLAGVWPPLYAH